MKFSWSLEKTIIVILVIMLAAVLIYFGKIDVNSSLTWMGAIFLALGIESKPHE